MEDAHAASPFDREILGQLCRQLARVQRLLRRQALPLTGERLRTQLLEMPLQQVAVDQRIAVVERQ
jgi:hypothetical protein